MMNYRFMMKRKNLYIVFLSALLLCGCATPKNVRYFQDIEPGKTEEILKATDITMRPGDKITIVVNSKDPLLADLFNLPVISHRVGYSQASSLNQSQMLSSYTVDTHGEIDFPVLGKISVLGKNREEIASMIKETLIARNLVNDPVITVEFANLCVNVIGEVNKPGRYAIDKDKVTLLEAISMAGDLTIFGRRENVVVMREENGRQTPYQVNLTSAYDLYVSPVYYLQQNDVVYVEPNNTRIRQSTVNGNNARSTSFWISFGSLLTTIAVLVFK